LNELREAGKQEKQEAAGGADFYVGVDYIMPSVRTMWRPHKHRKIGQVEGTGS